MESYYLDAVTEGEPAGRWTGRGAELLGLSGAVTAKAMETLFEDFVSPSDGTPLGNRPANRTKAKALLEAALEAEPDASPERRAEIKAEVAASVRTNVIGWDLTFAVPKSVTVLHTAATRGQIAAARAGDDASAEAFGWIRARIDEAITTANAAGLRAIESAATARTGGGAGGAMRWLPAEAMAFASFYQHTSRSIEPHLHVHNVALNKVLCEDGKWRAIDGQDLLAQRFAFSAVADRALTEQLASLGLNLRDRPDGAGKEASLVSEAVMEHFSTRRHQLDAALVPLTEAFAQRYGREPTNRELSQLKTYAQRSSRAHKAHGDQTADELNDAWFADLAAEVGHDLGSTGNALLRAMLERMPAELREALPASVRESASRESADRSTDRRDAGTDGQPLVGSATGSSDSWSPEAVIQQAVAGCAERSATWGRANLQLEIERNLPVLGIEPRQVQEFLEALTDQALAWSGVVQVTGQDASAAADAPRYAAPSATLYAAADTLAAEAALRSAAIDRGRCALDREQVAGWLDEHAPTIGADQRAAVEGIASSDAAVTVLVGPAGTGKSFAAGALANAWSDLTGGQGRVMGLAVSKVAAQVLADDGIDLSRNVAQWLAGQERLGTGRGDAEDAAFVLGPLDVVLVDEASMVGTSALERVRARVDAAGARLVLAGDPHQLGPVEAGGAMGLLDGHAETYTLTDVRRFRSEWERQASLAIRDGAENALDEYDRHARLAEYPTVEDAARSAATAAVADRIDGRSTVVVTATNSQAATVSARVRDQLVDLGLVAGDGGVPLGRDGNIAGVGDIVTCRRNDYRLGVTNRVQYRVLAAGAGEDGARVPDGALLVETVPVEGRPASGPVVLPSEYVTADVQLGYASTVHAAQGLTVDAAHLVAGGGTGLDAPTLYVGMTRGRERNTAHVALATPEKPSAPAVTTGGGGQVRLEDTSASPSARAVLEAGLVPAGSGLRHLPGSGSAATVAVRCPVLPGLGAQ
jgi:conjugative relaxase-like TrwC/TraI family protein